MNMKRKIIAWTCVVVGFSIGAFGIYEYYHLKQVHSTFENYYAFRGCTTLVEKTDTYGTCKTSSGETIKIVFVGGKWYLEGDGPDIW